MVELRNWLESVRDWFCVNWPLATYSRVLFVLPGCIVAVCLAAYLGVNVTPDSSRTLYDYLTAEEEAQAEYLRLQRDYSALSRVTALLNEGDAGSSSLPAELAKTEAEILLLAEEAGARACTVGPETTTCEARSDAPAWAITTGLLMASGIVMSVWFRSVQGDRELAPTVISRHSYASVISIIALSLLAPAFVFAYTYYRSQAGPNVVVALSTFALLVIVSLQLGAAWYTYVILRAYSFSTFEGVMVFILVATTVIVVPLTPVLMLYMYASDPSMRPGLRLLARLSPLLTLGSAVLVVIAILLIAGAESTGVQRALLVIAGLLVVGHVLLLRDRELAVAQYALARGSLVTAGDGNDVGK